MKTTEEYVEKRSGNNRLQVQLKEDGWRQQPKIELPRELQG